MVYLYYKKRRDAIFCSRFHGADRQRGIAQRERSPLRRNAVACTTAPPGCIEAAIRHQRAEPCLAVP